MRDSCLTGRLLLFTHSALSTHSARAESGAHELSLPAACRCLTSRCCCVQEFREQIRKVVADYNGAMT